MFAHYHKCSLIFLCVLLINTGLSHCNRLDTKDEGDLCFTSYEVDEDEMGICVSIEKCPKAIADIQKRKDPFLCGFKGKQPIVCCQDPQYDDTENTLSPDSSEHAGFRITAKRRVADKKCTFYAAQKPKVTTHFNASFIGTRDAQPTELPFMALIGHEQADEPNSITWDCSGVLISDQYVLTAAHCLDNPLSTKAKYVLIGVGGIGLNMSEENKQSQNFTIVETIVHKDYNRPSIYNDIGLVKLDRKVSLTPFVFPACLYTDPNEFAEKSVIGVGWESTDVLKMTNVQLISPENCAERFSSHRQLKEGIRQETQICAQDLSHANLDDVCSGTSGGPLVVQKKLANTQMHSILGTLSFGKVCGSPTPEVYTRVSKFVPWIEQTIWKNKSAS